MADASTEYRVRTSESFLRYDWEGKPVILREEFIESVDTGAETYTSYSTEIVVNDNPSEAEVFKYRLKQGI